MSLFDRIGEDLTDMMDDVSRLANPRNAALMKRLEASHIEACKMARAMRLEAAGLPSDTRYRPRRHA